MNLTKTNWPLGWTPSEDAINGDPNGLLRMDNMQQDEAGALNLVRPIHVLQSGLDGPVTEIFEKTIGGSKIRYLSTSNGANVYRNGTLVLQGGNSKCVFGSALGQVFLSSGNERRRDNGTDHSILGIQTPLSAPKVVANSQPSLNLPDPPATEFDTSFINDHRPDPTTLRHTNYKVLDMNLLIVGGSIATDPSEDTFSILCQLGDATLVNKVRVEFQLDDNNYFFYEWPNDQIPAPFSLGIAAFSRLTCKRGDFTRNSLPRGRLHPGGGLRQGQEPFGWDAIHAVKVTIEVVSAGFLTIPTELQFLGGAHGQITGFYEFVQVNVYDNGIYQAKSGRSPIVENGVLNGSFMITPDQSFIGELHINEIWIFRRSAPDSINQGLDKFYRSLVIPFANFSTATEDNRSDNDILEDNISLNEFLASMRDLNDQITGIEGLFGERMLYMSSQFLYFSDRLDPESIDARYTEKAFGGSVEKNLFIKKLSNNLLLLGTTKDLYELSGSGLDLPDGTVDITIRPLGERYPPLCGSCCVSDGILFYVAADGLRTTTGSNSSSLSPQLNLLWQNENRFGVPAVAIIPDDAVQYPVAVGRSRVYAIMILSDGTRRLIIYDLKYQRWRLQYTDPISIFVEDDDNVLLGYGGGDGNLLCQLDGDAADGPGTISFRPVTIQTVYDANSQPRNRKDAFTLKIVADTGGDPLSVFVGLDGGTLQYIGSVNTSILSTTYFDMSPYTLGFRYAIKLYGPDFQQRLKLTEITLEYELRPEQLNHLRINNVNQGTYSRKRWTSFAFVIDTLGNNVTFTPYVDNVSKTPSTCNRAVKLTYIHFFTSETIGTDIGGILEGGPFEFYNLNLEETVSEKLPTPARSLVIPANDYGTPNRKRHTSYKFQINTRGQNVRFTPRIDGINQIPSVYNTTEKKTVEHFFLSPDGGILFNDIVGIDIGGTLESLTTTEFEFYGTIVPQQIEVLPPRLASLYIPENNFGVAARKRIRTLPLVINTYGLDVEFVPIVDGQSGLAATFNTLRKQTVYYYFATGDSFGIDYSGTLECQTGEFEFYGFGELENVETLPVPKKLDQFQPLRFDRIGKLFLLRTRLIATGSTLPFYIFNEDQSALVYDYANAFYSGTIATIPNSDQVYEVKLPKNVNATILRIVLGPCNDIFHRYNLQVKVATSGMESDSKWIELR